MDKTAVEIILRILSIRNLPPLFQRGKNLKLASPSRNNARVRVHGCLCPACDDKITSVTAVSPSSGNGNNSFDRSVKCTAPSSARTSRNNGEVHWPANSEGGKLTWTVTTDELRDLRNYNPKLKLELTGTTCGKSDGDKSERFVEQVGWVIVDLRDMDIERRGEAQGKGVPSSRWVKISSVLGSAKECEMSLSMTAVVTDSVCKENEPEEFHKPVANELCGTGMSNCHGPSGQDDKRGSLTDISTTKEVSIIDIEGLPVAQSTADSLDSLQIGRGTELFRFTVRLEGASNLRALTSPDSAVWLSYACFGALIQTDKIEAHSSSLPPATDTFRLRSSARELESYFGMGENSVLRIYVCTEGAVVGSAKLDLNLLLSPTSKEQGVKKYLSGSFIVQHDGESSAPVVQTDANQVPSIAATICLEQEGVKRRNRTFVPNDRSLCGAGIGGAPRDRGHLATSTMHPDENEDPPNDRKHSSDASSQTSPDLIDGSGGSERGLDASPHRAESHRESRVGGAPPPEREAVKDAPNEARVRRSERIDGDAETSSRCGYQDTTPSDELEPAEPGAREREEIASARAALKEAEADFETRRRQWEEWRDLEEARWHERLREREAAATRALEDRFREREEERADAAEASRREYARLEARLRKALVEIEARERHVKDADAARQAEFTKKMTEVQLQERVVKEEAKHAIELERAKALAAVERIADAEKAVAAAERRAKQVDEEFEQYRLRQRQSPEAALHQEIATLKGKLADSESRILKERAEKNEAFLEKERFRATVHKLARVLKQERKKAAAYRQNEMEQLRVAYAERDKRFVLDGARDELRRINDELSSLHNTRASDSHTGTQFPKKTGMKQQPAEDHHQPRPIPVPASPPRRPESASPTSVAEAQITPDGNNMRPTSDRRQRTPLSIHSSQTAPVTPVRPGHAEAEILSESRATRLRREREDLLATGVYGDNHPIVVELDRLLHSVA